MREREPPGDREIALRGRIRRDGLWSNFAEDAVKGRMSVCGLIETRGYSNGGDER